MLASKNYIERQFTSQPKKNLIRRWNDNERRGYRKYSPFFLNPSFFFISDILQHFIKYQIFSISKILPKSEILSSMRSSKSTIYSLVQDFFKIQSRIFSKYKIFSNLRYFSSPMIFSSTRSLSNLRFYSSPKFYQVLDFSKSEIYSKYKIFFKI